MADRQHQLQHDLIIIRFHFFFTFFSIFTKMAEAEANPSLGGYDDDFVSEVEDEL